MAEFQPEIERPQLPKLNTKEKRKILAWFQHLIATSEFYIEGLKSASTTKSAKAMLAGQLAYEKNKLSTLKWLAAIMEQQKEESLGNTEFA